MPSRRVSNILPLNLPQLQNLIKRDAESYRDEFHLQWRHFQTAIDAFALQPSQPNTQLEELVMFVSQVAHCFPDVTTGLSDALVDQLKRLTPVMDASVRLTMIKALLLLHNRGVYSPISLMELAFDLLRCPDRELRDFLRQQIVSVIKNANHKRKNVRLNSSLQGYMFGVLKDSHSKASKISLDVMIDLYKKNIWNDQKTVNAISIALFSKVTKVMVAALQFFLGKDEAGNESDSESEDEDATAKSVILAAKFSRKTRKKQKEVARAKRVVGKVKRKKKHVDSFNFSALHLINDPQGLADRLYHKLESLNERYEVKLMLMSLVARLVGVHELFLFNFYPYLQRFIQPQQRDVTCVLQYAAQASHALVPPDYLQALVMAIANNFVTERNSAEVITVGINAIKEICMRAPLAMPEHLLHDLALYKKYRDKNVVMATRALIQLFRQTHPDLLHKKDRGRPTEAMSDLVRPQYGAIVTRDYIPGAETLNASRVDDKHEDNSSDDSDDSDGWQDVSHSSDDSDIDDDGEDCENDSENCSEDDEVDVFPESGIKEENDDGLISPPTFSTQSNLPSPTELHGNAGTKNACESAVPASDGSIRASSEEHRLQRAKLASHVIGSRLLTDAEFRHIDHVQLARHLDPLKKGKRKSCGASGGQIVNSQPAEIVSRGDIERIHKRIREDKDTRLATAKMLKTNRAEHKFGQPKGRVNDHASTTNREKRKTKNFMMMRHKLKSKKKKSFQEKQRNLRQALLKKKRKTRY